MFDIKKIFPVLLLAAVSTSAVAAAAVVSETPAAMRAYQSLALNATGDRLAAVESVDPGGLPDRPHATIVVRDRSSGKVVNEYDPCPQCRYNAPSWSPDQSALAFIGTDSKAASATLYVARQSGVVALVTLKGIANTARWSPDGSQLAMLATADAKKMTGAVEAGAPLVGEIGTEEDEQRIAIVSAQGGPLKMVSPDDTFVYEYDWTVDGKGFVVTSAKGNGDNNWWVATLGHVDAASGSLRVIAAPKMQMNLPRPSPDGKSVAFVGGMMSDFGPIGGDIYQVALAGGTPRNLTKNFTGSFNGLKWRGSSLLATALVGEKQSLILLDTVSLKSASLWSAPVSLSANRDGNFAFNGDGSVVASVAQDFVQAPHIIAGQLPEVATITHDNDGFAPEVAARSLTWRNEQFTMQGWLLSPMTLEAGKKYPLIVMVHGGPASAATPRYVAGDEQANPLVRDLIRRGYFVFMPNPRGSYGQGAAFASANKRDLGGGDWRDILAGVDAVIKAAPVDAQRLGLMGHSYGGFMTMWGVGHSQRFKAAVAGAGIANWISYYGQNGIDQWMIPYFGASAYDDPAVYRKASPIESIKAVKTPTLIYVGERDVECPPAQSLEFWHGLRAMGTPTSLVIYDGEGHAFRKPSNQRDLRERTVGWFDRYLK